MRGLLPVLFAGAAALAALPGERMYLEGILPSGQPMQSSGLPGTAFACSSCHLRSGLGKRERGVLTPPITAARLFQPRYRYFPELDPAERADLPEAVRESLRRPAYTEASLVAAIRDGVDPAGQPLSPAMPRYRLDDGAAEQLAGYLKSLSPEISPGVSGTTLSFATVIAGKVAAEDREAMLATLEHQVRIHNNLWQNAQGKAYRSLAMREPALAFRRWSLAVWELPGPASGWRAQLEARYREAPVFALVGGISTGDWRPVHEFCEAQGLPCVLPLTDFPVLSGPARQTLYFSGGFRQEGAAAAAHLARNGAAAVVQLVQDSPEGRALAAGFREAWAGPEVTVLAPAGRITGAFLARLLRRHPGAALALWAGPESYPALRQIASGPDRPSLVLMSASYLREAVWAAPQNARPSLLLTYPYRLRRPAGAMAAGAAPVDLVMVENDRRVRSRAYAIMQILGEGVERMGRNFYREHFMEGIGLMEDKGDTDYQVLRFGEPCLSAGCYLVRLAPGPVHGFVGQSQWVTF